MRHLVPIVLAFALALTACASPGEANPTPSSAAPSAESAPPSDDEGTTTTGQADSPDTTSGRPVAPDFSLELGDGGSYTLSTVERPVYLVFWAEWCPTCRRELPVVDRLAAEYGDQVDFVAPAWKSSFEATEARAQELFLPGEIQWGLDEGEEIFQLYGVPYQPVTVLIAGDQTVVESWDGLRAEDEIRAAVDNVIALSG